MQIGELVNGATVGDIINIEVQDEWKEYEVISIDFKSTSSNFAIVPEVIIRTREVI
jgi:hypothetical protein